MAKEFNSEFNDEFHKDIMDSLNNGQPFHVTLKVNELLFYIEDGKIVLRLNNNLEFDITNSFNSSKKRRRAKT